MEDRYTLLMQKEGGSVVNSYTEWGIVCCKVPFKAGGKTKELAKREWKDEHGEDVYIPNQLRMEGYDAEFELAYKGEELSSNVFNLSKAARQIDDFKKWLSGNDTEAGSGASLLVYSPYSTIGRKCYLLEISDEDPCLMVKGEGGNVYNENVVTFKVTFRVYDPMTNIALYEG